MLQTSLKVCMENILISGLKSISLASNNNNIIIEGLSLLQSIPPTTADKQTQAQKRRGSRSRKLLGAKAKSYKLASKANLIAL